MKFIEIPHRIGPPHYAIVDDDMYEELNQHTWHQRSGYATRLEPGKQRRLVAMHRVVRPPGPGLEVDHINRNRLDNRRENLRAVTRSENMKNRAPIVKMPLYAGAHWDKTEQLWRATIQYKGKREQKLSKDREVVLAWRVQKRADIIQALALSLK